MANGTQDDDDVRDDDESKDEDDAKDRDEENAAEEGEYDDDTHDTLPLLRSLLRAL